MENIETCSASRRRGKTPHLQDPKRGEHEQSGQADLALRYDLTVPLARVVAEYRAKLPKFFKRYQIQPVWRADRPQKGRFREFYQCDVDAIGSTSPVVEAEVCAAVSDVLERLGFADFTIRLNHREVLRGLLDGAGVSGALHDTALVAIDKLDKIGESGVIDELCARRRSGGGATRPVRSGPGATPAEEVLARLSATRQPCQRRRRHRHVASHLAVVPGHVRRAHLRLDPSAGAWPVYYTGAIFEIAVEGIGSLCAAGATTTWWVCSPASRCRPAASRWGSSASSW